MILLHANIHKNDLCLLISPAVKVNSLSSAASKSYKALTFRPSELLVVSSAEVTLGYKLVIFLVNGKECEVEGVCLLFSFNDNSIAENLMVKV